MAKIPAKRTFVVSISFKEACAAKGYLETQFSFLEAEITGNAYAGYSLVVEWESESQENIETETEGVQSGITWILHQ